MEISKGKLIFVLGSSGFLFVGWFVSLFLLVGAGFGALGMFFLLPVVNKWLYFREKRMLLMKEQEIVKLRKKLQEKGEVYG